LKIGPAESVGNAKVVTTARTQSRLHCALLFIAYDCSKIHRAAILVLTVLSTYWTWRFSISKAIWAANARTLVRSLEGQMR
jgi:hypothetical protein